MTTEQLSQPNEGQQVSMADTDGAVMETGTPESKIGSTPQDVAKLAEEECKGITVEMIDLMENEVFEPDVTDVVEVIEAPKPLDNAVQVQEKPQPTPAEDRGT